jgi:hypothetical protein
MRCRSRVTRCLYDLLTTAMASAATFLISRTCRLLKSSHASTCAKHIDLRAHFPQDHVEQSNVAVDYVPSELQLADFLTKSLPTPRFVRLREASGITECAQ